MNQSAAADVDQGYNLIGVRFDDSVVATIGTTSGLRFLASPIFDPGATLLPPTIGVERFDDVHADQRWDTELSSAIRGIFSAELQKAFGIDVTDLTVQPRRCSGPEFNEESNTETIRWALGWFLNPPCQNDCR